MSDNLSDHQYAYPLLASPFYVRQNGLTKRELFAAMAMQGMLTRFGMPEPLGKGLDARAFAVVAFECADQMLEVCRER